MILLDVRYNRNDEDLLEQNQWDWLDELLRTTNDTVYLIGSGI